MSKLVLTNPKITINSVDLSDHINSVTLDTKAEVIETSAFGSTSKTRVAGLLDNSVTIEWMQDFAGSSVEATIYPLIGQATTVLVQPVSASVSSTNPTYSFSAVVSEWQPLKGGVGQLATASTTWSITGAITKASA